MNHRISLGSLSAIIVFLLSWRNRPPRFLNFLITRYSRLSHASKRTLIRFSIIFNSADPPCGAASASLSELSRVYLGRPVTDIMRKYPRICCIPFIWSPAGQTRTKSCCRCWNRSQCDDKGSAQTIALSCIFFFISNMKVNSLNVVGCNRLFIILVVIVKKELTLDIQRLHEDYKILQKNTVTKRLKIQMDYNCMGLKDLRSNCEYCPEIIKEYRDYIEIKLII